MAPARDSATLQRGAPTLPKSQQPLNPQRYQILLALSQEDLHGSGIARMVLEQSRGEVQLWPATLYGTLDSLSEMGWIVELLEDERPPGESGKRRYYRITAAGRQALSEETEKLASLVSVARERLGRSAS